MKTMRGMAAVMAVFVALAGAAFATPSTHIWIPSTDIQPFGTFHFGVDQYITVKHADDGSMASTIINNGLTVGVLPTETVQLEVGIDWRDAGNGHSNPWYYHAKLGAPEDALFKGSPAVAVGGYEFGTERDVTNANIVYGMIAKTFGTFGRISAGYFIGNDKVLVDENGAADEAGVLLAWDRTMSEISDKLWFAVDYQGTDSAYGALSFGAAYKVAPNVGLLLGYDLYNQDGIEDTVTIQVDIDF